MSIEILPARLANQIAAGEVVERPASVIKELVENSVDAGATKIQIDVEKGGSKRLRIIDNGAGIVKDELTLALSRHATSKIKNLDDLEAISSLGFRGEALASISSVSRLTLTSKPKEQASAWQACAQGRDMDVTIQPAAHPDGTTIDVKDLFFNTPARRKFLRTDKTEFTHIEEVVRRIALACLNVTFILTHNGKVIRQYRGAQNKSQYAKRVAQVCGQKFVENALEVDCVHDNLHLWGWLAKPSYFRNQNDLCYSYVNGRMMRDKLINHAIRQAYADLLPADTYSAFVLFLELDHREVDVNVHPAKHEVRFHQGRYIHDFIFSVCNQALQNEQRLEFEQNESINSALLQSNQPDTNHSSMMNSDHLQQNQSGSQETGGYEKNSFQKDSFQKDSYVKPLVATNQHINDKSVGAYQTELIIDEDKRGSSKPSFAPNRNTNGQSSAKSASSSLNLFGNGQMSARAAEVYQQLMTPITESAVIEGNQNTGAVAGRVTEQIPSPTNIRQAQNELTAELQCHIIQFVESGYGVMFVKDKLRLVSFYKLANALHFLSLQQRVQTQWISQPLLLPVKITLSSEQYQLVQQYQKALDNLGFVFVIEQQSTIQIRQFPALLRGKDVNECFATMLNEIQKRDQVQPLQEMDWLSVIAHVMTQREFTLATAQKLLNEAQKCFSSAFEQQLLLNSVLVDLTSEISQHNQVNC